MCTPWRTLTVPLLTAALAIFHPVSSGTAQNPPDVPVFRTSTAAVMVDVVVRDGRGYTVAGLTEAEFEVFEDGVRQRIVDFAAMAGESHAAGRAGAEDLGLSQPAASLGSNAAQSVVGLVFHQLSHQSRAAAVRAARSMLPTLGPDEHAGIFVVDLAVTTMAPFTRNTHALEDALDAVLAKPPVGVGSFSGSGRGVAETDGPPGPYLSRDSEQAAQMLTRLRAGPEGPPDAAAQAASLVELVTRLAPFPGRKALILFSEGLAVSPRLEMVVERARAENVTVYSINAGGLGLSGPLSPALRDIDRSELTGSSRVVQQSWNRSFPELDTTSGLGPLARHTGGYLVSGTNDLAAALAAVNADRRAFYVLAYVSSNDTLDDTVRHIEVRVNRPGLSVRARNAYIAAKPDAPGRPAYEQPVLQALSRSPRPGELPVAVRAYNTPTPGHDHLLSLLVEVPADALQFQPDPARKRYSGEVAILTRLRDASSVVATQSQLYILTGDLQRLDAFRNRPIVYFRTAAVQPGQYKLEAGVHDRVSNRFSVTELAVHVPSVDGAPLIAGDLIVVRHLAGWKRGNQGNVNPLAWRRLLISPSLGEEVDRHQRRRLTVAAPLIVAGGSVTARLALSKGGHELAVIPLNIGKPDQDGRLIAIVEFPIDALPPGSYDLTMKFTAAGYSTERSTTVVLR